MLKFSKVVLHLATLNLSVFLSFSFVCADVIDEKKADIEISNVKQSSIISSNIVEQIFRNSDAAVIENVGNWYKISINGNSDWVHGRLFPVESILAAESAKAEEKAEVKTGASAQANTETNTEPNTESKTEEDAKADAEANANAEANVQPNTEADVEANTDKNEQDVLSDETHKPGDEQTAPVEAKSSVVKGIVDGYNVNVRKGPGKEYGVIGQVNTGDMVDVLKLEGEWYHITTSSGTDGWIYSDYILLDATLASRGSTTYENVSDLRAQVVLFAKEFLGVKYKLGGASPSGFDCSGFVWYVYNHFGIKLNRVASDQAKHGTKVAKSELLPGDLVFFTSPGNKNGIGHVGIYVGNGSFIHSSSGSSPKVIISDLTKGNYYDRYVTARRILD